MDTREIIKSLNDYHKAEGALLCDEKTIVGLINSIKHYMGELHFAQHDESIDVDESFDKGLKLLEILERLLLKEWYEHDVLCVQNVNEKADWYFIKDGELPDTHTDVLFCNFVGQVFEGFLEKYDTTKPYLTDGNKIAFEEYPDGGAWFDFRFRRFTPMRMIVAWCYKPEAVENGQS